MRRGSGRFRGAGRAAQAPVFRRSGAAATANPQPRRNLHGTCAATRHPAVALAALLQQPDTIRLPCCRRSGAAATANPHMRRAHPTGAAIGHPAVALGSAPTKATTHCSSERRSRDRELAPATTLPASVAPANAGVQCLSRPHRRSLGPDFRADEAQEAMPGPGAALGWPRFTPVAQFPQGPSIAWAARSCAPCKRILPDQGSNPSAKMASATNCISYAPMSAAAPDTRT